MPNRLARVVARAQATTAAAVIRRRWFPALGTEVEILLDGESDAETGDAFRAAEREVRRLEDILSAVRPDSQVSWLNRTGATLASPELAEVIDLALAGRESTGGRFEPVLRLTPGSCGAAGTGDRPGLDGGLRLDRATGAVTLDADALLDLGAVAHGWCADRIGELLHSCGPCLVEVGGTMATRGVPAAGGWALDADGPEGVLTLPPGRGAVATAEPAATRPGSDLRRVTVLAERAAWAGVLAAAFLASGAEAATVEADALGVPCVLETTEGIRRAGWA